MTTLTCRQVADFLMAYLDGELAAAERAAFDAHLHHCDECVRYLRDYQATVHLAQDLRDDSDEPSDAPAPLVRAILAARRRD
jgi:anti-sigma factor RsiW